VADSVVIRTERFPTPYEVETPPGAEGWEQMYPEYLVVKDERTDAERERFWFPDGLHWNKVLYPFDSITVEATYLSVGQYSTRLLALPPALGIDIRVVNGYLYLSPIPVTDPEEIGRRAQEFGKRAGYYFANWEELVERWREKVEKAIAEMTAISFDPLPENLESEEAIFEGRGRSVAFDVLDGYQRLVSLFFLVWQYHFEMVTLGYGAFGTFFQFCKQAFPDISDERISRMVSGIDVLAFRPDEELKDLARRAVELGVDGHFDDPASTPDEVLAQLADTPEGRSWIEALEKAKQPWFNFSTNYGFYHDEPSWINDLNVPFAGIRRYVSALRDGHEIARDIDAVRAERGRIIDEHRSVLTAEEAAQFDELLALAQRVFPHIEDHNFHIEHWSHTVFWSKMHELGALVHASDYLASPDDVFYLNRHELSAALFDVVQSWAIGNRPSGRDRWRAEVERRRVIVEKLRDWAALPALGTPPETVTDPFAIMNYGITSERLQEWLAGPGGGDDRDGGAADGARLTGSPGSEGVVEGPARVIASERELGSVQPGEILVCPITAPSWTPLLGTVAGVVSDSGGMMCHAAIVCREFGIPAVVGTGYATKRIETGQRLRIDGGHGVVEVLE